MQTTKKFDYDEFHRHNPMRPVDWRSQRLAESRGRDSQATHADQAIDREGVDTDSELVAHDIANGDVGRRVRLEAGVLAGQTAEEIAKCIGTTAEVVDDYERLYFTVRDRLNARDYIALAAVRKVGSARGKGSSAEAFIRNLGYCGGPTAIDFITPWLSLILSWDDAERRKEPIDVTTTDGIALLRLRLMFRLFVDGPFPLWPTEDSQDVEEPAMEQVMQDVRTLVEVGVLEQKCVTDVEQLATFAGKDMYEQGEERIIVLGE